MSSFIVKRKVIPLDIQINVKLLDEKNVQFKMPQNSTVQSIKEEIFSKYCKIYKPYQTILENDGSMLENNRTIRELFGKTTTKINLIHKKAELFQMTSLKKDEDKVDEITCEKGVAYPSCCNHPYNISSMKLLISNSLKQNSSDIQC